jgi:hypothetical protein
MALQTVATFTPSGYASLVTPPPIQSDPLGINLPYLGIANTIALPAGSTPATVLINNLGPEPAIVLIGTAAATTTATASAGSKTLTVASGSSIAIGQAAIAAGIPQGAVVASVSGTTVTINMATTAALSTTTINFVTTVTLSTGTAVQPNNSLALAYVSSGFISAICANGASRAILDIAVGV